ncbi:unnamed protein product [Periconia digitata]|uniref:Uncharacterized protein n=1 Tax=Periconia digitata TaxID=1303443 RepID=A0A9W4UH97_9PLEO|nr:unnamed protein product [Periconia digitata]
MEIPTLPSIPARMLRVSQREDSSRVCAINHWCPDCNILSVISVQTNVPTDN